MTEVETNDFKDFPIVTYSNRIQDQMKTATHYISGYYVMGGTGLNQVIPIVRLLVRNLPPTAKKVLKPEMDRLIKYQTDTNQVANIMELEEIYDKISDWIYENILQDAFKFKPKNPKQAHIGSGA